MTLASAAYSEYAGSTGLGNVGAAATGNSQYPEGDVTTQDTSSWGVCAISAATLSGDTFTADLGTIRQSVVPALTTAAVALVDNTSIGTAKLRQGVLLSNSRAWAAAAVELRTGVAATVIVPPSGLGQSTATHQILTTPPAYVSGSGGAIPVPIGAVLQGGTAGTGIFRDDHSIGRRVALHLRGDERLAAFGAVSLIWRRDLWDSEWGWHFQFHRDSHGFDRGHRLNRISNHRGRCRGRRRIVHLHRVSSEAGGTSGTLSGVPFVFGWEIQPRGFAWRAILGIAGAHS